MLFEKYLLSGVFKLTAPNFYCGNFNGRAVPWAFPLEFVCKSRVESRAQGRVVRKPVNVNPGLNVY